VDACLESNSLLVDYPAHTNTFSVRLIHDNAGSSPSTSRMQILTNRLRGGPAVSINLVDLRNGAE
jgi:hypothetical protein